MFAGVSGGDTDAVKRRLIQEVRQKNRAGAKMAPQFNLPSTNTPPIISNNGTTTPQNGKQNGGWGGDDDAQTIYSQYPPTNQQLVGAPFEVVVSSEEREARVEEWNQIRYGGRSKQEIQDEEELFLLKNKDFLDNDTANQVRSASLIQNKLSPFVPFYSVRIHDAIGYCELAGTLKDRNQFFQWQAERPMDFFGSYTDWCQGQQVGLSPVKTGRLQNTYVIEQKIMNLESTFPCAIGIRLGEVLSPKEFKAFDGRKYYTNQSPDPEDPCYHLIVPPFGKIPEIQIYRSTSDINDPYGMYYTNLTELEGDILNEVQTGPKEAKVPTTHCILEWIYKEANISAADLPTASQDDLGFYKVKNSLLYQAKEALKEKIKAFIPVKDLTKFAIRVYPLNQLAVSMDTCLRAQRQREKEFTPDIGFGGMAKENGAAAAGKNELAKLKDNYGVTFHLQCIFMFRDYPNGGTIEDEKRMLLKLNDPLNGDSVMPS